MKPRIFLGSSVQQEKLLQALTRGLQDIADVEPWTTVFNPGVSTLDRLVELSREVDFAAFVFAHDDWTTKGAAPDAKPPERPPHATTSSSKPGCSVGAGDPADLHSPREAPSSRPTSSA